MGKKSHKIATHDLFFLKTKDMEMSYLRTKSINDSFIKECGHAAY
jgi:hypothetical protein